MTLLDRVLVRAFLQSYVICLISLLGLYIVVDLFTNLEDFTEMHSGLADIFVHIGTYYGFKVTQIFDRLCEAIVLLAAMFTIAWMQRHNELMPLLSAGVSIRRVVQPVVIGACSLLTLSVLNQELLIPHIGRYLVAERADPWAEKDLAVRGGFEPNGVHLVGDVGSPRTLKVTNFCVTVPENLGGTMLHLTAREARYVAKGEGPRTGGWELTGTVPAELDTKAFHEVLEFIDPGKYFLHTQQLDFENLTRPNNWYNFVSTSQLMEELSRPDSSRLAGMAVLFHTRLTRPVLGVILVLLGLSVILRDQNRNVFISAGMCLGLCGLFFGVTFVCKQLGDYELVPPAMAAWLPVLGFGPLAVSMFDGIHT